MGPFEVVAVAIVLGTVSGIATKYLDTVARNRNAAAAAELRAAQERIRLLEARAAEARRPLMGSAPPTTARFPV